MNFDEAHRLTIGIIVSLNVVASAVSVRSGLFERHQLLMQLALVWLLPLFGAALVLIFTLLQSNRRSMQMDRDHSDWENMNAGHSYGQDA